MTKKKKKFKIIEPVKETQIIDYIPEKKECNSEEIDIEEIEYLTDEPLSDEEDNIELLEEKLFSNENNEKSVNNVNVLFESSIESTYVFDEIHNSSSCNNLEPEAYNY